MMSSLFWCIYKGGDVTFPHMNRRGLERDMLVQLYDRGEMGKKCCFTLTAHCILLSRLRFFNFHISLTAYIKYF